MKNDQLILVGALAFAGFLVAKKSGVIKAPAAAPVRQAPYSGWTNYGSPSTPRGYDVADPGAYVTTDGLIADAANGVDYTYVPTFDQQIDSVLGIPAVNGPKVWTPW